MVWGGKYSIKDGVRYEEWHNHYKSWVTRCSYYNPKDQSHYGMYIDHLVHAKEGRTAEEAHKIAEYEWERRPKNLKLKRVTEFQSYGE